MKKENIVRFKFDPDEELTSQQKKELENLRNLKDEDIDFSDIPETTDFTGWKRGPIFRPRKEPVSIRLDADVLAWFKENNEKYQSAINAALRDHMMANLKS